MTIQNNSYITSIMSELQTISTQSGIDKNGYTNSIFGAGYGVINIAQGGHAQKVNGIQQIVNSLTSLLAKLISNEASEAENEVTKTSKKAKDTDNKAKKTQKNLNKELTNLENDINSQNASLENMTKELANKQEEINKEQEEANKVIEKINAKQSELAKETDPQKQSNLLEEIGTLSGELNNHIANVTKVRSEVSDLSSVIEKIYTEIETAKGNQVTLQEDGVRELGQLTQETADNASDMALMAAEGVNNEYTAATATAAAEAASSNMFTAAGSVKLYRVAADQKLAGTTRITGATNNINTVRQGIGNIASCADLLQKFDTSIGGALNNFNNLVGSWNNTIEPMITSLGSWTELETSKEELDKAIKEDTKIVNENKPVEAPNYTFTDKEENIENNDQPGTIDVVNELKTPTVKIKQI